MMTKAQLTDLKIDNSSGKISLQWGLERPQELTISKLRGMCPCAGCQGHGKTPAFIANTVKSIIKAEFVGNYALSFLFGDGHSTGIYTWDFLRQITELESCS